MASDKKTTPDEGHSSARPPLEGDLYLLPPSPWSQRVLLAMHHARASPVGVHEYTPVLTAAWIWMRQGFPRGVKVTAPAMRRRGRGWLMDSQLIAREIDAARAVGVPSLFPEEEDATLRRMVALAETLQSFSRMQTVAAMLQNPALAVPLFLPPFLQRMPFAAKFAKFNLAGFADKYKDESAAAQEAQAREAMREITEMLARAPEVNGVRYLVAGRMTFADIAVALALPLVKDDNSAFKDVPVNTFEGEFEELRQYVTDFLHKHARGDGMAFPPPRFDADGSRPCG